jgi:sn-glycerol 3-phosphate transport system ATP-binding protein
MAELELDNLSKTFASRPPVCALESLSLRIASGSVQVLLGPSGSGKTTTLRLISGLENPSAGRILLNGREVQKDPPRSRPVGMVFQHPALLPQLNVRDNLLLGPKLRRVPGADAQRRIGRISELLGLGGFLARFPETLSGGQQQRVALGRVLASQPQVILLDEPLANLDPISRIELRESFRAIQRELKITAIYVTHDQSEAAAIGGTVALLKDGRLQQVGLMAELYRNPANLFTAQFIGPDGLNFVKNPWCNLGGDSNTISAFRPSAARIVKESGINGQVLEFRDLGWDQQLVVRIESNDIRVQPPSDGSFLPGQQVGINIDPSQVFVFDASTGARIR